MSEVIVGVDLSLTATGVATLAPGFTYEPVGVLSTIKSKPTGDSYWQRDNRIREIIRQVFELTEGAHLVVVEGPAYSSRTGSAFDRAGLWWRTVSGLYDRGMPVGVVPPTTVKKWATGKGTADKTAVVMAVAKLWATAGAHAFDFDISNDNEADALCLATMGAQWLQLPTVPTRAHHAEAVSKGTWTR